MSQVSYGTITITDTNDIERIYTVYAKSNTNTDVPTAAASDWKELISEAPGTGNYIWQRTVVEKSGTGDKTYSSPVCLTGEEGEPAKNIIAIEVQYGISANWNTQPSSWSENTPSYDSSKPNYWTRTRLKYEGNTYSSWVTNKDYALTEAIYNSVVANSIAQHANEDAQGAMSQAAAAQYATEALAAKVKHYWWDSTGAHIASGINGADVTEGTASTYGFNSLVGLASMTFGYNSYKTVELDGSIPALKFYKPSKTAQGDLTATLDSNGLVLSKGGVNAGTSNTNNYVYISSENGPRIAINGYTPPDPTAQATLNASQWREIIGTKFGVLSDGTLYANEAHISGEITASKLTINSNATISDTSGLISNSAVEVGGRNLFIGSIDTHLVNGSVTDTKTTTMLYFWTTPEESYTGYNSFGPTKTYSTTGHFTETFTAANDALNYFCIKHNGSTHDFAVYFEVPEDGVKAGETLTMSFDIVGFNPSVENGLDIKNFKLERGNKATDWTPAPEDIQNALGNKTEDSEFDEYKETVGNDLKDISKSAFGDEDSLSTKLNGVSTEFDKLSGEYSKLSSDINTYMSFNGALVLGNSENGNNVTITDTQVQFKDNNNVVGYIGGNGLHVDNYLSFGAFMFYQRTNGHFTLKYLKKESGE